MSSMSTSLTQSAPHLVLIHGADRLSFPEDIGEAERRGIVVHALDLPRFDGHPIDDVHVHYREVASAISTVTRSIRQAEANAVIVGIGRNLGGSMLAYTATGSTDFRALVLTGAIPDLSRYKARSEHQGAQRYRDMIGSEDQADRFSKLADLDLVATLPSIRPELCLLQAGLSDPWMDEASFDVFRGFESSGIRVEYPEDDHAMVGALALRQRWRFIETRLEV